MKEKFLNSIRNENLGLLKILYMSYALILRYIYIFIIPTAALFYLINKKIFVTEYIAFYVFYTIVLLNYLLFSKKVTNSLRLIIAYAIIYILIYDQIIFSLLIFLPIILLTRTINIKDGLIVTVKLAAKKIFKMLAINIVNLILLSIIVMIFSKNRFASIEEVKVLDSVQIYKLTSPYIIYASYLYYVITAVNFFVYYKNIENTEILKG